MDSKREDRAIDALIVSQLRSNRIDVDIEQLPELTQEEREQLDSLGEDFVDRLLAGEVLPVIEEEIIEEREVATAGGVFGMNRAKDVDEDTKKELDQNRQDIIDRIKEQEEGDGNAC